MAASIWAGAVSGSCKISEATVTLLEHHLIGSQISGAVVERNPFLAFEVPVGGLGTSGDDAHRHTLDEGTRRGVEDAERSDAVLHTQAAPMP